MAQKDRVPNKGGNWPTSLLIAEDLWGCAGLKAGDAMRLYRDGKRVAHIAKELGIGRGSVYRALEAAGMSVAQ